jgi:hypothetical protein
MPTTKTSDIPCSFLKTGKKQKEREERREKPSFSSPFFLLPFFLKLFYLSCCKKTTVVLSFHIKGIVFQSALQYNTLFLNNLKKHGVSIPTKPNRHVSCPSS